MLAIKYLLLSGALGLTAAAVAILIFDARIALLMTAERHAVRWRLAARLGIIAIFLLLPGLSIVVVPSGTAGVRVSQLSGTLGTTL